MFAQQAARAIYEADYLSAYYSTFYYNPKSNIHRFISSLSEGFSENLLRRRISEVPLEKMRGMQMYELLRVLSSRIDKKGLVTDKIHELSTKKFDNWVAKNLTDEIDGVYCYEYNSLETLKTAKRKGLFTIYEIPSPEHNLVHEIIENELKKYPETQTPYYNYTYNLLKERTERRRMEYKLADIVIVNSEFTKNSYEKSGLNTEKIKIVSLGCPNTSKTEIKTSNEKRLKMIWAGKFNITKGAHYLLEALIKEKNLDLLLDVYGKKELSDGIIPPDNRINFKGNIPRENLLNLYGDYDVIVLPTLYDGFGMVITEALSKGLPVITSINAGASDLIIDGYNGFKIRSCSSEDIRKKLLWCINNLNELRSMKYNALESAKRWQWSDYRKELVNILRETELLHV